MKRREFLKDSAALALASAAAVAFPGTGAARAAHPQAPARDFRYGPSGRFKVLQFTDTHHIAGDPRSERALLNVRQMLDMERPDLVIHTGDIIYATPALGCLKEILSPMVERQIPFAVALGNHDGQFDLSREGLYERILSFPYCVNSPSDKGITGVSNDVLTLSGSRGTDRVFYLFDSGAMAPSGGYDYVHYDQIGWYRKISRAMTEAHGGKPVPSLAFVHIPPREFSDALRNAARQLCGNSGEEPCPAQYNSGLVLNMKEMGDIQAVVCGHDHDCDFVMLHDGMFYIYGRYSGGDTEYNHLGLNGCRVFEFTEGDPSFRTWVRLYGGEIRQRLRLGPDVTRLQEE